MEKLRNILGSHNIFDDIYDPLPEKICKILFKQCQAVEKNVLYKMYPKILNGSECPWIPNLRTPHIYYSNLGSK